MSFQKYKGSSNDFPMMVSGLLAYEIDTEKRLPPTGLSAAFEQTPGYAIGEQSFSHTEDSQVPEIAQSPNRNTARTIGFTAVQS